MSNLSVPKKVSKSSISNIANLCKALGISQVDLANARSLSARSRYRKKTIGKPNGADRVVYAPCHQIRFIQSRINTRILAKPSIIKWPRYTYGSIPNQLSPAGKIPKDHIACAARHCKSKSILKLDISDFFDNIDEQIVFGIFHDFLKYDVDVANALTDICCLDGTLIQGALTSSYLANLSLHDVEGQLEMRLRKKSITYTRYIDDITVSSRKNQYDFSFAQRVITEMLDSKDLPINTDKTSISFAGSEPLCVHGLRVDFRSPRLSASEVRNIRAAVKHLEIASLEIGYRTKSFYHKAYNKCMGRVNKLSRVGHSQHTVLLNRLRKIPPLPSNRDAKRVIDNVNKLIKEFTTNSSDYSYRKFYDATANKLVLVNLRYPQLVARLRSEMLTIPPNRPSK